LFEAHFDQSGIRVGEGEPIVAGWIGVGCFWFGGVGRAEPLRGAKPSGVYFLDFGFEIRPGFAAVVLSESVLGFAKLRELRA
jgi:hypothetical protein